MRFTMPTGSGQVSTIYTSIDSYWVIMEVKPEFQRDPKALGLLYIRLVQWRFGAFE